MKSDKVKILLIRLRFMKAKLIFHVVELALITLLDMK